MPQHRKCFAIWSALLLALWAAVAFPGMAQPANTLAQTHGFHAYDKASETTFTGTIVQVISHPTPGSLIGMHLLVASGGTTHDVHLGSFLPKDLTDTAFRSNQLVQVIGMNVILHGQPVTLARQVISGGRLITVRDEHGFPVMMRPANSGRRRVHENKSTLTGGLQ